MLRDLHREFGEFHFGRRDLQIEVEQGIRLIKGLASQPPSKFAGRKVMDVQTVDGVKLVFDDESWQLLRQSGTEPALRIYAEAPSVNQVNQLLDEAQKLAHAVH
jgi:phosphomannomutase